MVIHSICLFHTVPSKEFSHCAFSGRTRSFPKMMQPFGYKVIEYSNEGSESGADEIVVMLDAENFKELQSRMKASPPHGEASTDSDIYRAFTEKLTQEICKRAQPGDIVMHYFGHSYTYLVSLLPHCHHVEGPIGYPDAHLPLRIYETYQWWSWHQGKEQKAGNAYQWVCPMGYDIDEWEPSFDEGKYLLYFGRVIECKGLHTVMEIAKNVDMPVIMCGSGTPEQFLSDDIPNLTYQKPVTGLARSELLRGAYAMLMPTVYTEPFGGAGVEGQLCGTPLIASDFGAFSETIIHGYSGFRCKTLGDYLAAIRGVKQLNRRAIASTARERYSLQNVGAQMDRIFKQVQNLGSKGWYSVEPTDAIWK